MWPGHGSDIFLDVVQKAWQKSRPQPQYGWDFPEEIPEKNSGKTPETLSERFLEFPSRVRLGCPKPCNSKHLRLPERFQNSLPPSTAGDASFFRIGSGEGLSELVIEFPVLGVFLKKSREDWNNLKSTLPKGTGRKRKFE